MYGEITAMKGWRRELKGEFERIRRRGVGENTSEGGEEGRGRDRKGRRGGRRGFKRGVRRQGGAVGRR